MKLVEPPFYVQKAFDAIGIMFAGVLLYGVTQYPPTPGSEALLVYSSIIGSVFVGYTIGSVVRKNRVYFDSKNIMVRKLWRPYQSIQWSEISKIGYWFIPTEEKMTIYNQKGAVIAQLTSIYIGYDEFKDYVLKHAPDA